MAVICKVDYNTALKYKGSKLTTTIDKTKHNVYFCVEFDNDLAEKTIDLAKYSHNIAVLENLGDTVVTDNIYVIKKYNLGLSPTEHEIKSLAEQTPRGTVPVFVLPDDFTDTEYLYNINIPNVRYTGKNILSVKGLQTGVFGIDLCTKYNIKDFSYIGEAIDWVDYKDIKITETKQKPTITRPKPKKLDFSGIFGRL